MFRSGRRGPSVASFGTQAQFWKERKKERRKSDINYTNKQLIYIKQLYVETDAIVSQSLTLTLALTHNIPWYNHIIYDNASFSMTNILQRRSNIYILPSGEL